MNNHDIKCADGCDTVLGSVDLDTTKGKYRGDAQYGFLCDPCSVKRRRVQENWREKHSRIVAKVAKAASITPQELESLLRATR